MNKALRCLSLLTMVTLCGGTAAQAAAVRVGATTIALAANTRGSVVGYDSVNHAYLVVSTFGMLRGQFVDGNGGLLGTPFVIQGSGNFTHFPTVAFSPDADGGAGGFLVVWHESDLLNAASIHARVVSVGKNGPAAAETILNVEGSFWEQYPAAAYSTASHEFLVTWVKYGWGLRAIRADNAGAAIGAAFTLSMTGQFEGNPSAAYNPVTNQFLVAFKGWNNPNNFGFIQAQLVQAGTGQLLGTPTLVYAGGGTYITDVAYDAETNQFLTAWYVDSGGANKLMAGRIVDANGGLPGNVIALSSLWKAYDALGLAHNRRTGTFYMVSHDGRGGNTIEDGGVEINANGTPVDNGILVTADGGGANFYPRLAASADDPNWMLVASNGFLSTIMQRVEGTPINNPQPPVSNPAMVIDTPQSGFVQQPVWLAGWGLDFGSATGTGVDTVHVWAWPDSGAAPIFVGAVAPGMLSRPDVGAAFGSRFTPTGWGLVINGLPGGTYTIAAYLHSTVSGTFNHAQFVRITIADPLMSIDTPSPNSTVSKNGFMIGGWALDRGATTGTGVDTLHMWAWPTAGGSPTWAGVAAYGGVRPDLGAILGPQFTNCGFNQIIVLPPGQYDLAVYSHSSVTNSFSTARLVRINVQ